jgi:hypothetical protein
VDPDCDINPEIGIPTPKPHEQKIEAKRAAPKNPSTDLTDRFKTPILSHRDMHKPISKKPLLPGARDRNYASKISPLHKKSPHHLGASTPKTGLLGKSLLISRFSFKTSKEQRKQYWEEATISGSEGCSQNTQH